MRFLTRFAPYLGLAIILTAYAALIFSRFTNLPIEITETGLIVDILNNLYEPWLVGLIFMGLFIVAVYFSAVYVVGRAWALLPTMFLIFSPALENPSLQFLSSFLTLIFFGLLSIFVASPSRTKAVGLAASILLSALTDFSAAMFLPMAIFIIILAYAAGALLAWPEVDPANRRNFLYLRAMKYGMPSIFLITIVALGLMAIGLLLPPVPDGSGFLSFMSQNSALEPLARYGAYFVSQNYENQFFSVFLDKVSLSGFAFVLLGLILGVAASFSTLFRNLGVKFLWPILSFVEIRPLEFVYLIALAIFYKLTFFGFSADKLLVLSIAPLLILTGSAVRSWCVGKSAYFSGGVRISISAFDKRISNQAIKYGLTSLILALHIVSALSR